MKPAIIFFYLMLTSVIAVAQFTVVFQPDINMNNVYGLSKAVYYNSTTTAIEAEVVIDVTCNQQKVVQIVIPSYNFHPGPNGIPASTLLKYPARYGSSIAASILKQTGIYAEGEYEFCFNITPLKNRMTANEFCFSHSVISLTPLILLNPSDGESLCFERPVFSWQPPIPMASGSLYRLILVAVDKGQSAEDAISSNMRALVQDNISINILPFPTNLPPLQQGKRYAWQVAVYNSKIKTTIAKSEIWQFQVQCDKGKNDSTLVSYREIKSIEDGNFHIATNELNISVYNPYGVGELLYKIYDLEMPLVPVTGLPKVQVQQGYNYYTLDLKRNTSFKNGKQYLMQVTLRNGEILKLRFIYKLHDE